LLKEQGIALVAQITEEKIMGHESGSELAIALSISKKPTLNLTNALNGWQGEGSVKTTRLTSFLPLTLKSHKH